MSVMRALHCGLAVLMACAATFSAEWDSLSGSEKVFARLGVGLIFSVIAVAWRPKS